MGHSAGLRAGTRVCESPMDNAKHLGQTGLQQLCSTVMELELTGIIVCLLARFQEEGYDQALDILETVQVGFCS